MALSIVLPEQSDAAEAIIRDVRIKKIRICIGTSVMYIQPE
jgi:hypothetical protein